jgi:hypothetical protein
VGVGPGGLPSWQAVSAACRRVTSAFCLSTSAVAAPVAACARCRSACAAASLAVRSLHGGGQSRDLAGQPNGVVRVALQTVQPGVGLGHSGQLPMSWVQVMARVSLAPLDPMPVRATRLTVAAAALVASVSVSLTRTASVMAEALVALPAAKVAE